MEIRTPLASFINAAGDTHYVIGPENTLTDILAHAITESSWSEIKYLVDEILHEEDNAYEDD